MSSISSSLRLNIVEIKYKKWWGRFVVWKVIDSRRGHGALTLTLYIHRISLDQQRSSSIAEYGSGYRIDRGT